ncbi:CSLREA domain-containing protein, partial [Acinetobacter baumannii]
LADSKLYYQPNNRNSCDIGSIELMKLTAGDIKGLGNTSLTDLLAKYQSQYDTVQKNILNPDYAYLLNVLKIDSANYKNLFDQTKANAKYR